MAETKLPELYLPKNIDPEVRKAILALNSRVKNLGENAVTIANLKDPDFLAEIEDDTSVSNDKTPPNAPSSLVVEKFENKNRLTWVNSTSSDVIGVYIYRAESLGGSRTLVGVASYPLTHYSDSDVTPFNNYWYYIKAVDDAFNTSDYVPATDSGDNHVSASTLPAPDEIIYPSWDQEDLSLSWDPVDGFGVAGYRIEIVGRRTVDAVGTEYTYTFSRNAEDGDGSVATELTARVWTIGTDGSLSPAYTEATITHSLPPNVTGAIALIADMGFTLRWGKVENPIITGYDLALDSDVVATNYTTESYLYEALLLKGSYQLKVRSRNKFGQVSEWNTQILTVHGPYAPTGFTSKVIDNNVMLYWNPPANIELPIVEYEVRYGNVYAPGNFIGRKQGTFTLVREDVAGTYNYIVAAVDSAGNVGDFVGLTTYVDDPPDFILNVEWKDDFLNGNSTNVLVLSNGIAYAPCFTGSIRDKFIGTGTSEDPQFTSFRDILNAGHTQFLEPVPASAEYFEGHDYGALLKTSSVSIVLNMRNFNGGPTVTPYIGVKELSTDDYTEVQADRSFSTDFQYAQDRYVFSSDGIKYSKLFDHTLRLDSKIKSDVGKCEITYADDGVDVTFNRQFIDVQHIDVTAYVNFPYYEVITFVDEPYPTGFNIRIANMSGVFVACSCSWGAKGY